MMYHYRSIFFLFNLAVCTVSHVVLQYLTHCSWSSTDIDYLILEQSRRTTAHIVRLGFLLCLLLSHPFIFIALQASASSFILAFKNPITMFFHALTSKTPSCPYTITSILARTWISHSLQKSVGDHLVISVLHNAHTVAGTGSTVHCCGVFEKHS